MFNKNEASIPRAKNIETIIGPSVRVEGNFKGEGDLLIDGMLVGSLQTKNNLKIGAGAIIEADVKANNAFISGKVKGNITVKGKLEVTSTAVILGDIKTETLSVESGALIQGKVSMAVQNFKVEGKDKSDDEAVSADTADIAKE